MKKFLVLCVVALMTITGCASNSPTQSLVYMVVVQQGTSRFIEHKNTDTERAIRAEEIIRVVGLLKIFAGGDDATVESLQARALEVVSVAGLRPSDELLAGALVQAVADVLRERVQSGVLRPEDRIRVELVLDQIASAARIYIKDPADAAMLRALRDIVLARIDEEGRHIT